MLRCSKFFSSRAAGLLMQTSVYPDKIGRWKSIPKIKPYRLTGDIGVFGQHEDSPGRPAAHRARLSKHERTKHRVAELHRPQLDRARAFLCRIASISSLDLLHDGQDLTAAAGAILSLAGSLCGGEGTGTGTREEKALSIANCAVLRELLDRRWREQQPPSRSSSSDFKLPLSFVELEQLIGQSSAQRLSVLARGFFDKILLRRCSAEEKGQTQATQQEGDGEGDGQGLCIRFHLDESRSTTTASTAAAGSSSSPQMDGAGWMEGMAVEMTEYCRTARGLLRSWASWQNTAPLGWASDKSASRPSRWLG
eukprot:gene22520-30782_t